MDAAGVRTDRDGPVWTVTLNRPERRNALTLADRTELLDALGRAEADEGCRAIVLTGAAPVFCAGGDIRSMTPDPSTARRRLDLVAELARALVLGSTPVVAAVEGGAFGLGLSLAAACDYVVSAANARFVASFGRLGLVPDTGLFWSLAQRIGPGRAKELILFGTEVEAAEAHRIGLVSELAEPGGAVARAVERAHELAVTSPAATAAVKQIFVATERSLDALLAMETEAQVRMLGSAYFARRQREFLAPKPDPDQPSSPE